ncbi:MAG: M20/M25/M40 family metallo-hydrolase [Verrucomicrobia bacterium]|nr:M20/M25/M40 family metallo-hydrolase [Verrucomicrobiota bacterium]
MVKGIGQILAELQRFRDAAGKTKESLLANLVMIGEIPAPTFGESERVRFVQDRFSESGLQNSSSDEVGNGFGILPGKDRAKNILVVAHADTVFSEKVDHTITVETERVVGPGVADNSISLAALATLPMILDHLGLELDSNLILMVNSRSLGRGNLEGLRFFLKNNQMPIRAGVCVEGVELGRLTIGSFGMLRGEITCQVSDQYDWTRFGTSGAIVTINEIINRLVEIPLPRRPKTSIVLGSIEGGTSFNTVATRATLRFEIRSESEELLADVRQHLEDAIAEVSSASGADVTLDIFARRKKGGILSSHPLARHSRSIMKELGVEPRLSPSASEISAFVDGDIPAVTLGLTEGGQIRQLKEFIRIDPVFTGIAQLVGVLLAIDGGYCDEHE